MLDRSQKALVASNVVALAFNSAILGSSLPSSYKIPFLNVRTSVICVASFSLISNVIGIVSSIFKWTPALLFYSFSTVVVTVFYFYAAVLCFIAPSYVPVDHHTHVAGVLGLLICIIITPTTIVSAKMTQLQFTTRFYGAFFSMVSLIVSVALLVFSTQVNEVFKNPSSALLVASSTFEILDCVLGIPMFLCNWSRMLQLHTAYSVFSAFMLLVGSLTAIITHKTLRFMNCTMPPPTTYPPQPLLPPPVPLPPPPSPTNSTSGGRHLLQTGLQDNCTNYQLALLGALASISVAVAAGDIVCSVLLLKNSKTQNAKQDEGLVVKRDFTQDVEMPPYDNTLVPP